MKNFESSNWLLLLEVLLGCLTVYSIGLIIGALCGVFLGCEMNDTKYLMAILSSPNTTSLPIILIEVFHPLLETIPFDGSRLVNSSAKDRGMLYISLTSMFVNVWRWSVAYNLIEPPKTSKVLDGSKSELSENLLVKKKDKETPDSFNSNFDISLENKKNIFSEILNPPLVVSLLTLTLCFSEYFKQSFVIQGNLLHETVFNVNYIIARCYNFCMLFLLGMHLAEIGDKNVNENTIDENLNNKKTVFNIRTYIFLAIVKLVILPIVGVPILLTYRKFGLFRDSVMLILLFFFLSVPPANNCILITSIKKTKVKETAFILLFTNLGALLTLTIENSIYLYLLIYVL